jgi:sugar lactone lactonase YvrE
LIKPPLRQLILNKKEEDENMNGFFLALVVFVLTAVSPTGYSAWAQFPDNPSFTRLFTSITSGIEGLTGDNKGFFYVVDRGDPVNSNCSVWRIDSKAAPDTADLVGKITAGTCRPSGLTFDKHGDLFITAAVGNDPNTNVIYKLTPNATNPTSGGALGQVVVKGVFGANGVAFDKFGKLYISDGVTNQGRVWRVNSFSATSPADCTTSNLDCEELFRIPPRLNAVGVGSERTTNAPPLPANPQNLVANGLAFNLSGDLLITDTARGAIWRAEFTNGDLKPNQTNCDPTFLSNTLCFDNLWVADPRLEGLDGIALDLFGNVWGTANERNALLVVTSVLKRVIEVFQNPPVSSLRNAGPLEFPTSPFLSGRTLCITQADSGRRDNVPNAAGDIPGNGAGKVSCMDQSLIIPGLPLPVQ